ncbi:hypothetical protein [Cellulomonas sp. Y8]|uniref:hypothetical protein n=1 Tax=Cellulomonas sp. Y8 TaxID=2591145 RepID=UPI003D73FB9E
MSEQLFQSFGSRQTSNPKTVLAFYATIFGITIVGMTGLVMVLATTKTATGLIPWILGVGTAGASLLVLGVYRLNSKDPAKLMLGQITGSEYASIQSVTLGDSSRGERVATVAATNPGAVVEVGELGNHGSVQEEEE